MGVDQETLVAAWERVGEFFKGDGHFDYEHAAVLHRSLQIVGEACNAVAGALAEAGLEAK